MAIENQAATIKTSTAGLKSASDISLELSRKQATAATRRHVSEKWSAPEKRSHARVHLVGSLRDRTIKVGTDERDVIAGVRLISIGPSTYRVFG